MQTKKLRVLQQPTQLTLLLDSLVMSQSWVPKGAHQVADRSELPSALQKLAIRTSKDEGTWQAWLFDDGVQFFSSEMSLDTSRERGCAALNVHCYNERGQLKQYSQWTQLADGGRWQRCAV
jgi:hypothetical protein